MSKTLQDYFGSYASLDDYGYAQFDVNRLFLNVAELSGASSGDPNNPSHIVAALIYYWLVTNYEDKTTGVRLSQDKASPIVSLSEKPRASLVERQGESQIKYDFSFSIYSKANNNFNPQDLVGEPPSSNDETPEEEMNFPG